MLVTKNDSLLVTSSTDSTQALPPTVRLDVWLRAKEWYNRSNSIERAEGGTNFITMQEAYNDMVWEDEQYQEQVEEYLLHQAANRKS